MVTSSTCMAEGPIAGTALDLSRLVVVGTSCSGKTTFARRLAGELGTRHIELDTLYWGPQWTPQANFDQRVRLLVQNPDWVIDGNYSTVRDVIWRRATALVWLDYPFFQVLLRALRRTSGRVVSRERLYGNNQETVQGAVFDLDAPIWLVVRTHRRRRREFPALFNAPQYRHMQVIRLHSRTGADKMLSEVKDIHRARTNPSPAERLE
jgi:hypothetical protein